MKNGFLYATQLWPSHLPKAHKLGFSEEPPHRNSRHKTVAPQLRVAHIWKGTDLDEQAVLQKALDRGLIVKRNDGRESEVVMCDEDELIELVNEVLTNRRNHATN